MRIFYLFERNRSIARYTVTSVHLLPLSHVTSYTHVGLIAQIFDLSYMYALCANNAIMTSHHTNQALRTRKDLTVPF